MPKDDAISSRRFPISMPLEYQLMRRNKPWVKGRGTTINLSSTGVLFESQNCFHTGDLLRLVLDWPIHVDRIDMVLVIEGRIVRTSGMCAEAEILKHILRPQAAHDEEVL